MPRQFALRLFIILTLFLTGYFCPVPAESATAVAVLYPDLQEPYRDVVNSIIEGIQEKLKDPVRLFSLQDESKGRQLKGVIDSKHFGAIIALGHTGLVVAKQWQGEIPIIAGAQLLTPEKEGRGISGISLDVDPEIFFNYLTMIAPGVKRVHVVYSAQSSAWLIQEAREVAKKHGFQLMAYKSEDIRGSALIYRDILAKSRPSEDAIWLLPDPVVVDDKLILPLLLQGAWDQSILIFSSNPGYVRRGALFALYPDNTEMGRSLAKMAERHMHDEEDMEDHIIPLSDVQAALNIRTAEHVGLFISDDKRQKFTLIFPTP
jgi:putative ABC transport system substrate-binding protein